VERVVDTALEQAESVLDCVRVDFAPCIALVVMDDAMLPRPARGAYLVCGMRVCLQHGIRVNVLYDLKGLRQADFNQQPRVES